MKTFTVFAFALCCFLAEGGSYPNFQLGAKEIQCLNNLESGKPNISKICLAYEYFKKSIIHLGRFDSRKVKEIFKCVGLKKGGSKKQQKDCLKKVLPGANGLRDAQEFIKDVKQKFKDAVDGDKSLLKDSYRCLQTPSSEDDISRDPLVQKVVACSTRVLPEQAARELFVGFVHARQDFFYARHSFGDEVTKVLTELNITTVGDYIQRVVNKVEKGQKLFNSYEERTGERFLPGQWVYVKEVFQRYADALNKAVNGANGKEPRKDLIAELVECNQFRANLKLGVYNYRASSCYN